MDIPQVAPIRQVLQQPEVADVAAEVRQQWQSSQLAKRLKRGDRVLVGVGSRGIANIQTMVQATLDVLRDLGTQPAVVAAMGSHGGATAKGQRELLASYGVTEENLRVPVLTDMDAVQLGNNSWGEPVWWDKNALAADAVVTISRVKAHTDFKGAYESGICKMLVIGLGKQVGAAQHHRWGVRGLKEMLIESCKVILEKGKFVAGLAVLENAREHTGVLKVLHKEELLAEEPKLLEQSKQIMGRLPFEQLDVLVVGELGKNYSGAGMDPNVLGRLFVECSAEFTSPRITRICVLDVSPESHGNAVGVGLADLTTDRLLQAIDPVPFRMNTLTSCFLHRAKLPIGLPNDRDCIDMSLKTSWVPDWSKVRMAVIPNTLELEQAWVTQALVEEAKQKPHLKIEGDLRPLPFDATGNLLQEKLFPHSVRSRRSQAHG